jgi:thiamine kinase-like enzyme
VPAHVDAGAANFVLGADGSLFLVDWEFSSMADPAWDVASVLGQRAILDDHLARRFVAETLGDASDGTMARIILFKVALCLVAGSWCAMEAFFRKDDTLEQAANGYLDRCAGFLSDPRLPQWLEAV